MFPIRRIISSARWVQPIRAMSGKGGPLVDLAVDGDGIAVLTMQRLPVNSLNLDLLQAMEKSLDEVAKNKDCKGLILTSVVPTVGQSLPCVPLVPNKQNISYNDKSMEDNKSTVKERILFTDIISVKASPTVFSAGLDIMEMYKPDLKRVESFWTTLQSVWFKLFGSNFPTAAAINGHAPAGGCLLAMSCEYRAMVSGKFTIGLNETALGIVAPKWFMDTMTNTISKREAEFALTTARMFSVDAALKVGLIDEVATDKADSIAKCKKFIERFDNIPPLARALTKQKARQGPISWLQKNRQQDLNEFLTFLQNPKVQQALEMYIQILKQKSAK